MKALNVTNGKRQTQQILVAIRIEKAIICDRNGITHLNIDSYMILRGSILHLVNIFRIDNGC